MILIHLASNGKTALIDPDQIAFAEEIEAEKDGQHIVFTRVWLKQPLSGENTICTIDIEESIDRLKKLMK